LGVRESGTSPIARQASGWRRSEWRWSGRIVGRPGCTGIQASPRRTWGRTAAAAGPDTDVVSVRGLLGHVRAWVLRIGQRRRCVRPAGSRLPGHAVTARCVCETAVGAAAQTRCTGRSRTSRRPGDRGGTIAARASRWRSVRVGRAQRRHRDSAPSGHNWRPGVSDLRRPDPGITPVPGVPDHHGEREFEPSETPRTVPEAVRLYTQIGRPESNAKSGFFRAVRAELSATCDDSRR